MARYADLPWGRSCGSGSDRLSTEAMTAVALLPQQHVAVAMPTVQRLWVRLVWRLQQASDEKTPKKKKKKSGGSTHQGAALVGRLQLPVDVHRSVGMAETVADLTAVMAAEGI